ncbi:hypothetical protein KGF56_001678 [Candida oxycetoniae]|uniref:Uncharacterized protein n=1 Tax=Candida oxycetoniae TaxID=497107 RepID=A0AAI9SZH3_9ASCO|nr:uncharacterized protein KGF56_001678 [Candida oxycetoniae]KAI3405660.1 hypothetical protein KGF56_001678 [Candida oxycetoniae]
MLPNTLSRRDTIEQRHYRAERDSVDSVTSQCWSTIEKKHYSVVVHYRAETLVSAAPLSSRDTIQWWSTIEQRHYSVVLHYRAETLVSAAPQSSRDTIQCWSTIEQNEIVFLDSGAILSSLSQHYLALLDSVVLS